jgi:hypothetical protein
MDLRSYAKDVTSTFFVEGFFATDTCAGARARRRAHTCMHVRARTQSYRDASARARSLSLSHVSTPM